MRYTKGSAYRVRALALLLALANGGCSEDKGAASAAAQQAARANPTGPRADQLAAALLAQFPEYDECPRPGDAGALRYVAGVVDLNSDGTPEVVALALGREACGSGGCTAFVLRDSGTGYQVVTRITTVSAPILAAADRSAGWRDLIVGVAGGGAEPGARVLRYSGNSYPENASLAPPAGKRAGATPIIADEPATLAVAAALVPPACTEPSSVTATEALGGLRIGAPAGAVEPLLGHPKALGKPELWEADGLYHRTWTFPASGAVVGLSATKAKGPWQVFSLTLKRPGKLTTTRGIGIGTLRKDVLAAYGNAARPGESAEHGPRTLIVGTEYDALVFSFDVRNTVEQIFLGATSE
jgi:hypothetical protein